METGLRKCEAVMGPDDICTQDAHVITADGTAYCEQHNLWAIEQGDTQPRNPAWVEGSTALPAPEKPKYELTVDDLATAILQKVATTGHPEGFLVKVAWGAVQGYYAAFGRWLTMEIPARDRRKALWLSETEANKILSMLAGQKSVDARAIRQAIQDLFN